MSEIKEAIIDKYYTFDIFDNTKGNLNKKYYNVLEKLAKSSLLINSFDENKEVNLQERFEKELNRRQKLKKEGQLMSFMREDFIEVQGDEFCFNGFENEPYIIKETKIIDLLKYSQERACHHYVRMLSSEEVYTGINSLDRKNVFLLHPIRIKECSDEIFYIDIYISLYKHGYGILNASIRQENIKVDKFSFNKWDIHIKAAYIPRFMFNNLDSKKYEYKKIGRCTTIEESLYRYINVLQEIICEKITAPHQFDSMTVLKLDNHPKNFENENISIYQTLCKLLFAPANNLNLSNKGAKIEIEKYSKEQTGRDMKIIVNSLRCLMIYSGDIAQERLSDYPEEFQKEVLYSSYRSDITFALEKLLLRKITIYKYLERMSNPDLSLNKMYKFLINRDLELRYETDQIFYNYSTTRDYIDFFYDKGIEPSIYRDIEETVNRVQDLILLRRENRVNKISVLGTVMGLIITTTLSMAGIKTTLGMFGIDSDKIIINVYLIFLVVTCISILLVFKDILLIKPLRLIQDFRVCLYLRLRNLTNRF